MNEEMIKGFFGFRFIRALSVLAWVGVVFLVVLTINELRYPSSSGSQIPPNVITVSGEGEAFAKPDTATFSFTIEEESGGVPVAQKAVDDKTKKALDFLKKEGVEEKDIKTISYQVYPKYEYQQPVICNQFGCPPQGEPKVTGYKVSQTIEVKIKNIEKAGDLLSGVGEVGVMNLSGLNFAVDNEDEIRAEAREEAINEARDKAKELADQLNVRLVRIISFSESGYYPPIYYGKGYAGVALDGRGGGDVAESSVSIAPGETRVVSNVSITYEIR